MDDIQRWLAANLKTLRSERARADWFDNLPKAPEGLSFWLRIAVDLSATEPWWYDTLAEYARRCRQPDAADELRALPAVFLDWCAGVAANDIARPKHLGRPPNELRDQLIRAAVGAYMDPARDGGPLSQPRACARVAEAVDLEENTVAKIWRRGRRGKQ
ncbi:MAG: hypothetical protein OXQ89_14395 [Rhodospirillaceae bacterium]|nr:hypothetical protein [Rhodospirillaceae bacterium]MDD9998928.1 hypothetical protein [Rhodospirillaceae bacterium]MDE0362798.1 hypothetical protein [Rhodospirillaceae bacterium]